MLFEPWPEMTGRECTYMFLIIRGGPLSLFCAWVCCLCVYRQSIYIHFHFVGLTACQVHAHTHTHTECCDVHPRDNTAIYLNTLNAFFTKMCKAGPAFSSKVTHSGFKPLRFSLIFICSRTRFILNSSFVTVNPSSFPSQSDPAGEPRVCRSPQPAPRGHGMDCRAPGQLPLQRPSRRPPGRHAALRLEERLQRHHPSTQACVQLPWRM